MMAVRDSVELEGAYDKVSDGLKYKVSDEADPQSRKFTES